MTVVTFDLIMGCMVVLNLRVYFVARRQARRIENQMNIGPTTVNTKLIVTGKNRKAAKLIGTVNTAYVLCSLPLTLNYLAVIICKLMGSEESNASSATLYTVFVRTLNSAMNPVIFHVTLRPVRKATRKLLDGTKIQRATRIQPANH